MSLPVSQVPGIGNAQETRTVGAPVPRRSHASGPAMSVGVVRPVSGEALRLGGWARWQRLDETTRAYTVGGATIILELDGYDEVIGRNISALSVGGALGAVLSGGSIPLPEALGPAYQRWIAPELAHAATGVGTRSGHLGVRWESPGGHGFWARLKMDDFGPDGGSTIPGLPSGDRQRMSLSVGASLAGS